ncbi:MAG: nucleotide exchange factor GrpE [Planctomycetes bacterium]|nr:nucleotide exchange factor GrpE [Planctomycetota bacterium]MCB9918863.1 nucleotide exchange factor GrpE [Planctomycetota bacterium]
MGFGSKRKGKSQDVQGDDDAQEDARVSDENLEGEPRASSEDVEAAFAGGPGVGEDCEENVDSVIERLRHERDDYEEKLKHTLADIANMRRRANEDAVRAREQAIGRVTQELLPVIDAFELALGSDGDRDALLAGVRMVQGMLEDLLGRHGVEEIASLGEPFDPNVHEALASEPRDDVAAGTIVAVHQKGFRVHGRVLRPARVIVAAATNANGDAAEDRDDHADRSEGNA